MLENLIDKYVLLNYSSGSAKIIEENEVDQYVDLHTRSVLYIDEDQNIFDVGKERIIEVGSLEYSVSLIFLSFVDNDLILKAYDIILDVNKEYTANENTKEVLNK